MGRHRPRCGRCFRFGPRDDPRRRIDGWPVFRRTSRSAPRVNRSPDRSRIRAVSDDRRRHARRAPYPGVYPGMLPPPVAYPQRSHVRRTALWLSLLALVLVGAVVARGPGHPHRRPARRQPAGSPRPRPRSAIHELPERAVQGRHRDHRAQQPVRHVRRGQGPQVRSGAGPAVQRRVPQAVLRSRGDLDRQDRAVVDLPGAGVVHHEGGTVGRTQQPRARSRAWRSCCARATSYWCARICCERPPSTELDGRCGERASVERVAAGAGAGGVGVVDGEALLLDGVDEVDRGALDVGGAHPVDGQGRRRRTRRSGHRRGRGRRRTGCSAGRRSHRAGPRSAAPGRRGPPGPAATWPWRPRRRSGPTPWVAVVVRSTRRKQSLRLPNARCLCGFPWGSGPPRQRYLVRPLFPSRCGASSCRGVRRASPASWLAASSMAGLHRAGVVGDRVAPR